MSDKQKRKQMPGGARLKAAGKQGVLLGLLPDHLDRLRQAAALEMRPVTQFITFHALKAADALIAQSRDGAGQ